MNKIDVLEFSKNAENHMHNLWNDIESGNYRHDSYTTFQIRDPKLRTINKACVRDRILHQVIFTKLEPVFDRGFIFDSYSSRKGKGMLAMLERFESFANRISSGNRRAVWVLKCDVRKFFDSVDHDILKERVVEKITSPIILEIITEILGSF
jgi:retron-type reverse transcriptase